MNYLLKTLRALSEVPRFFFPTRQPRLIMTLLVKNEEAMIERNLQFHKQMGIDGFIVTDNNSSDGTMRILEKYKQKGWILEIIEEQATGYEQKRWVDRMVEKAKCDYKADWVINADADEFWYARSGNLKNELSKTHSNVVRCPWQNMFPEDGIPFWQWKHHVVPVPDYTPYDLSPYAIYERRNKKVAHRADGYIQISMGNHKVAMFPRRTMWSKDIVIYHFTIRGRQQFIDKMVQGGRELEKHEGKHGGRHWRYFYELYKQGKLEAEYERVIGLNTYDQLCRDGYIKECLSLEQIQHEYSPCD